MNDWHIELFNKSIVKQEKFRYLKDFIGDYYEKHCLDLGSDNGVISYFLRQHGGSWVSADIEDETVEMIRRLVKDNVFKIEGEHLPFANETFDLVAIVDLLEHIAEDRELLKEIDRVLKKEGTLVVNVPNKKKFSFIRGVRNMLGLTDEQHGHVREGYTFEELRKMLPGYLIEKKATYSKFITELIDIAVSFAFGILSNKKKSKKGTLVGQEDIKHHSKALFIYSFIYPFILLISRFDCLLFFMNGYRLIVKAKKI